MIYLLEEIIALLVVLVAVSQGAVVRSPTIDNPCQANPVSTGTSVVFSIKEQIQLMITSANTADTMCRRFKEVLRTVLPPTETSALDSLTENVPGLYLAVGDSAITAANNVSSLKQDYQEVSTHIMYLRFFKTLQVSVDSGKFTEAIDVAANRLYSWLCNIDTILRRQNNPLTEFVDNSAVNEDVKAYAINGDTKNRYGLYYVAMKNIDVFIRNKNLKWAIYVQTLN